MCRKILDLFTNVTCALQSLLKLPGFTDNVVTHILSGLGAGFIAVCVGSPVDVVRVSSLIAELYRMYSVFRNVHKTEPRSP
jgi:hypothetical protein